ncbi:hypothetical protein GETHLI_19710 [Geothrix limicola]|uniref:Phosphoglycerate mutase n=2 Tax=Geothrix limicola TaxID=2927978 RepID=A0ABQ5QHE6_9BACT|nr:hypothetical protein GETHLI_19710 [Geothrix limicola]
MLLRHGPTTASQGGAPLGRLDLPVSPEGEARWPEVKRHLQALNPERVLCSPLQRSRRHAEDLGFPLTVLEDLSEQAFGTWEGRPWDELCAAEPTATTAFFEAPFESPAPNGESFDAVTRRALRAFEGAWDPARTTLVLAHAGPLRAILTHLLGEPRERALEVVWQPFGLTCLEVDEEGRAGLCWHNHVLPGMPCDPESPVFRSGF